jgi:hypothetical protein
MILHSLCILSYVQNNSLETLNFGAFCADIYNIQGDKKASMHLMITLQKVTSNVQSVPRQPPDIY